LEREPDGLYKAGVLVEDSKGNKARAILTIVAKIAGTCDGPPPPCPEVTVECPREIGSDKLIEFLVNVRGSGSTTGTSYTWVTDAGKIVRGKYENRMTLDLLGFPFEKVTGTVIVRGYDPSCPTVVSCTTRISANTRAR
jgi:hypothetical protein